MKLIIVILIMELCNQTYPFAKTISHTPHPNATSTCACRNRRINISIIIQSHHRPITGRATNGSTITKPEVLPNYIFLNSETTFSARAWSGRTRSGSRENGIISTVYVPV